MKKQLLFTLLANLLMVSGLIGQTTSWTGASSTSWTTAGNWAGGVPANNSVTIINIPNVSGGSNRYPVLSTAINYKGNIEVQTGASLTIASGGSINWTPDVNSNFIVVGGGTITIQNGGSITLNSATKGDAVFTIDGTLNNAGTITNTNGDIYFQNASGMGATTLNCSGSGTVSNSSYIDGTGTYTGCLFTNPSGGQIGYPNQIDCITFGTGLTNNGTMEFDLTAGTACTNYDKITVTGIATLAGGTMTAIGSTNGTYTVLTATTIASFTNSDYPLGGSKYAHFIRSGNNINAIVNGNAVLGVELLRFDVHTEGSKNHLTWATASETNNKGFDIERSRDGATFQAIGTVKALGKAGNYTFTDAEPVNGTNYYRLRQIDFDGTETYSKVVSVANKGGKSLKVYPTLVSTGFLTVDTEGGDYAIYNVFGQQVQSGKTAQRLDVSTLAKGTYILKVGTEQAKFVKQ